MGNETQGKIGKTVAMEKKEKKHKQAKTVDCIRPQTLSLLVSFVTKKQNSCPFFFLPGIIYRPCFAQMYSYYTNAFILQLKKITNMFYKIAFTVAANIIQHIHHDNS